MTRLNTIVCTLAITAVSTVTLTAFASHSQTQSNSVVVEEVAQTHAMGKHCSGTVGCDCPGFKPITDGKIWQEAYCKHCGHKRTCHK